MGRGNVCTTGQYEGLFYVDHDDLHVYCSNEDGEFESKLLGEVEYEELRDGTYYFDQEGSMMNQEYFEETLVEAIKKRFPSFSESSERVKGDVAILENELFYICITDNGWSDAVLLLQKDDDSLVGLQKRHSQKYLVGIRDALFQQFETIGVYGGPWTSGRIRREEVT